MKSAILLIILIITYINKSYSGEPVIEKSGDILQIALPTAAFASTFIWNDEYKGTIQCAKAMVTTFIVTESLKHIIDKERPNGGHYSFPSGHTSAAFTGAAFLERRYGLKVGIPSYLLASFVGWSRIYANKHDYWDVGAGAALGIISAYIFTKPYKNPNVNLSFGKNKDQYTLYFCYKF